MILQLLANDIMFTFAKQPKVPFIYWFTFYYSGILFRYPIDMFAIWLTFVYIWIVFTYVFSMSALSKWGLPVEYGKGKKLH